MEQATLLQPNNTEINNVNKDFFRMGLEIDAIIKNLASLTIYNWQSANAMDSFIFFAALYIQNSIRHTNNNSKSSTLYCYLIQSNSDLGHIQYNMGLINNINNKTIMLQQTITKACTLIISDVDIEVGDNVANTYNSV